MANSLTEFVGKVQPRDSEGHVRDWEADGIVNVNVNVNGDTAGMSARWGDREWVKTVERAYWRTGGPYEDEQNGRIYERLAWVDSAVEGVLEEMCRDEDGPLPSDEERSARRLGMLRTQYHVVVSEVIGLAVKW
jgi:hypothetical protein